MKREECYEMALDRQVFDLIIDRFGAEAADNLTAEIVDEIRAEAFTMMSEAVKAMGPIKGLFEEAVEYVYKLRFVF
jgi:dihydropteroate synthase